jgi:hypothetical protein
MSGTFFPPFGGFATFCIQNPLIRVSPVDFVSAGRSGITVLSLLFLSRDEAGNCHAQQDEVYAKQGQIHDKQTPNMKQVAKVIHDRISD